MVGGDTSPSTETDRDWAAQHARLEGDFSCPEDRRDEVDQLDSEAESAGTTSIVGFVVGGVGVASGSGTINANPPGTCRTMRKKHRLRRRLRVIRT